jgi:hypothetical protein
VSPTYGPPAPLPNFLIIGVQRGGSTFLHQQLRAHPEIFMPPWEEGYFDDPFYQQRDERWLRDLFAGSEEFAVRGFRDSQWLARPEALPRIARDLPGVRLLAALREPVSRAVSTYFHYVGLGLAPVVPLNQGLRQLLAGEWDQRYPAAGHILEYSRYGPQIEHLLSLFEKDRFLVLINEELRQDPAAGIAEAYRFLEVDPTFDPPTLDEETNLGTRRLGRLRVRRFGNRFVFTSTHDSPSGFTVRDSFLGRSLSAVVTRFEQRVVSRVLKEKPHDLDSALRAELTGRFAPDVAAVEDYLGRPIPSWRTDD